MPDAPDMFSNHRTKLHLYHREMRRHTTFRGGELDALARDLRDASTRRDEARELKAVKKVVSLMTSGVDVSSLFMDIIMVWPLSFGRLYDEVCSHTLFLTN